jgi:hypothetical protein
MNDGEASSAGTQTAKSDRLRHPASPKGPGIPNPVKHLTTYT